MGLNMQSKLIGLYTALEHYMIDHLLEALLEDFEYYNISLNENVPQLLDTKMDDEKQRESLLKIYMTNTKPSYRALARSLNQVEPRTTIQELGLKDIYLDGFISSGVANGVCVYEALKLSTPIACKYFPSRVEFDGLKEWEVSEKLHTEVNNSSYVIKYLEKVVSKSGGPSIW